MRTTPARQALAVAVAAVVAVIGAFIVGEYDFSGTTPYVAGLLFGLVIAEVILTIARVGRPPLMAAAALISGGGVLWAAWMSTQEGVAPIPGAAYAGVVLSMVVAAAWVATPARGRRRPAPPPPEPAEIDSE